MTSEHRVYLNRSARGYLAPPMTSDPLVFHRSLDGYAPTPLRDLSGVADRLGLGRVVVKDETSRLGLPAFKILGASWAIHRALADEPANALVTATDGNHGRAVARTGRLAGKPVRVFVPAGVHPAALEAIAAEGAEVVTTGGSYDDAVARAAEDAEATGALLVQDTALPGYEKIPDWIVDGYSTIFREIDEQLAATSDSAGVVIFPVGVGSLAQAAVMHYRGADREAAESPALMSVEPTAAPCVLVSLNAGSSTTVPTGTTIMAGLNCGTPSSAAWPHLRDGLDAAIVVDDVADAAAAAELHQNSIDAGPCGAAALAGLNVALGGGDGDTVRGALGLTTTSTVVLLCTEGTTANPALLDAPPGAQL